jgi:hypothetical protein
MEVAKRRSISDGLQKYDFLAKSEDFVEVTEWTNGEGYDISFDNKIISLTRGQIDAINYLIATMDYDFKDR